MYFITRKEYGKEKSEKIEFAYKLKTAYYAILFSISLVMLILSLIDYLSLVM